MKNSFYDIDIIQLGKYLGISANDKMSEDFIISDIRYNSGLDMLKYPCRFNGYMGIFCLKGNLEAEIKHAYFKDEEDAEEMFRMRRKRQGLVDDRIYANEENSDTDEPINTSPTGLEGEGC